MVSLIILNYNRKEDILFTLKSILSNGNKNINFEIILVDQNSNDGSQSAIKREFPNVILYCSPENLGVAGGRNKGAELAQGKIFVFLDDDSHFQTMDAISKITYLFNDERIGIIGFKILDTKGEIRDWVYTNLSKKHSSESFYSQQYVGCGHAIRADLFNQIKGYSEDLFFWGEEIEFCLKTYRDTNYKILYWPEIEVVHRVSPISRYHWKTERTSYKTRNRFAILYNYFPKNSIYFYLFFFYFFFGYFIRGIQNSSLQYFLKGFKESFKLKLTDESLDIEQAARYSRCYIRQFIGKPKFYS